MPTFISLLRGINVSGKRKIRMAELTNAYEKLGLTNVRTYLQSGNVVFASKTRDASRHRGLIEREIRSRFGHEVTVLVRTPQDLGRIIDSNPFSAEAQAEPKKVHVTFLMGRPSEAAVLSMATMDTGKDRFSVGLNEVFLYCPGGYGRTKLNNTLFERKFEMPATTRNFRTVEALYGLASAS